MLFKVNELVVKPVKVGEVFNTTAPVPVEIVTPVTPLDTGSVPAVILETLE